MLGNHNVYQIHRRRQSVPASPASPKQTQDTASLETPKDESTHHAVTAFGNPALNVDVPSPLFDLSSFSNGDSNPVRIGSSGLPPSSEEHVQHPNTRLVLDRPRPATSASNAPSLDISQNGKRRFYASSPLDPSYTSPRPLSSHGTESPCPDVSTRYTDRAYTNRNHSHSSLAVDSSPVDETPPSKFSGGKKSRLNLLNPMSLLARRRSSQNQNKSEDVGLHVKTQSVLGIPDDYDPRIRGNIIHDFSAPRPRKIQSSLDSPTFQSSSAPRSAVAEHSCRASDFSGIGDVTKRTSQSPSYSPVFKEHFQDDQQSLRPAQTGYLHSLALLEKNADISNASVPAFAKKLPVLIKEGLQTQQDAPHRAQSPHSHGGKPTQNGTETVLEAAGAAQDPKAPPSNSQVSERNALPAVASLRRASGIPKHMTSTSSRFSFVGNGDSAAQEKLLEERHKQHANNNSNAATPQDGDEGQDDDDYDDYDFDSDACFEEQIPGVNADADEEENFVQRPISQALNASDKRVDLKIDPGAANNYGMKDHLQEFHFTPDPSVLSSVSTGQTSQPTPRDENGQIIGLAGTSYSPLRINGHSRKQSGLSIMEVSEGLSGLGLSTAQPETTAPVAAPSDTPFTQQEPFRDEDLYFDDGEFDDLMDDVNSEEVDERIFDDGNGTLLDIPAENARKLEEAQQRSSLSKAIPASLEHSVPQRQSQSQEQQQTRNARSAAANGVDGVQDVTGVGLTESNLAAYHAALVSAADCAAANGRFTRTISDNRYSEDQTSTSQLEDSPPGLSNDDKRYSHNVGFSGVDDDENFPFDDDDEDDLIAEANAEVLENDDDGFYGQEFGFYARAKGKNTSELEYGGYFTPRGSNGIQRSHSGKANFQEPSLTPITERSEWSPRNSMPSLLIPGIPGSAQQVPSPSITQTRGFESSGFDENISFEALMKLRRGAFGGSSTSVNSLGGPPSSSPLAHISAHSLAGADASHRLTSSITSLAGSAGIPESDEEENNMWEEPTFTRNTPTRDPETSELRTPESMTTFSPVSARSDKGWPGHSRNSSGAESVSYMRDTDGRWLLERRRTGEGGEGELIEREYLAGSRI